jgi:dihydroxyacetone kinase-like protein
MILIKTVGGASGPLYGTFFLRAGGISVGKETLDPEDIVSMLEAGLEGVVQRGRADLNDKTMVDALTPALDKMNELLSDNKGLDEILEQGASAAQLGMEKTIPMQAKKGRASYLGKRSIGHQDPGATSAYLLLKTMAHVFGKAINSDTASLT